MSTSRYRAYRKAYKAIKFDGQPVPYNWSDLPENLGPEWFAYSCMVGDYSSEIANSINLLTDYRHRLRAWAHVIGGLSDQKKLSVRFEFIDPVATMALTLPTIIKARFIFAVAHLCHQANQSIPGVRWADDLPSDHNIEFETADCYGARWRKYGKLKLKIERLGDKKFQAATHHFRNTLNHRFSPNVVFGETNFLSRIVDQNTNRVTYAFGGTPPLELDTVTELLMGECSAAYSAFAAFQAMIREHEASIVEMATSGGSGRSGSRKRR